MSVMSETRPSSVVTPVVEAAPAHVAERLATLVLVAVAAAVLFASFRLTPDHRGYGTHEQLGLKPCTFKVWTGYPCMTCGMTTSFTHMAHFQPLAALRVQPAGAVLFLMTLAFVPFGLRAAFSGRSFVTWLETSHARWVGVGLLVVLAGSWIYAAIRFGGA